MADQIERKANIGVKYDVGGEEIVLTANMIKNYLTHGNGNITNQEAIMFMNLCKYQNLNPFLNEAYLIKFGNQPAQIVVSKEAFMKRAESHPAFDGFQAGLIVERNGEIVEIEGSFMLPNDKLFGGWAKVYRKDRKYPTVAKVGLDEYDKKQSSWKTMTKTMIRKVALTQALREAFPTNLGAMYSEEEVNAVHNSQEHPTNVTLDNVRELQEKIEPKKLKITEQKIQEVKEEEINPDITIEEPEDEPENPEIAKLFDDEPEF
jgi:phage recombination protein Bet